MSDPLLDDVSIYVHPGTVYLEERSDLLEGWDHIGMRFREEVLDAERIGFRGIWTCERYSNKIAPVLLGAAGALSPRLELATAPIPCGARPPLVTAGIGGTLQAVFGPRVIMGIGRSSEAWLAGHGFHEIDYQGLVDYASIMKRLWRGERVTYDGPAGSVDLGHPEPIDPAPPIVFCCMGGPKSSKIAVNSTLPDGT